jgi:hypothetical protein
MTEFEPKILAVITGMEWGAPRGFGSLLVRIGRKLRGAGHTGLARAGSRSQAAAEAAGETAATIAARRAAFITKWRMGPRNLPTQPELDKLLDEAWVAVRGKTKRPPIFIDPSLVDYDAEFRVIHNELTNTFRTEIGVSPKPVTPGELASRVSHEAWHARFVELFPALTKHEKWSPLWAWIDEWIGYAIGGAARVRRGTSFPDKLLGIAEIALSNFASYISLARKWPELIPAIIRDIIGCTLFMAWLAKLVNKHLSAPRSPKRRAAPGTP